MSSFKAIPPASFANGRASERRTLQVIFVNRFFHPDQSATSQMLSDLAFGLAEKGITVVVVTSRLTFENPDAKLPKQEVIRGVRIERVASTAFGRKNNAGRLFDYFSFHCSATLKVARLAKAGDIIVAKTDPPLISVPLSFVAQRRRAILINWLQDLFPEVLAAAMGNKPLSGWLGWLKRLRNRSLRIAGANVVLGKLMARRVEAEGAQQGRILIAENWSDGDRVRPVPRTDNELRKQWGLLNKFVVGYSGNLGVAHEFDTMIEAAASLNRNPNIAFLFVGAGAQLRRVKRAAEDRQLSNIHFQPYQSQDRLAESLSVPDVHLVCLRPDMEGLIVPSKFYGVLAAGRPCIFIGDRHGELAEVIAELRCGAAVQPGASAELAAAIDAMASAPLEAEQMGRLARQAFDKQFDRRHAIEKWTRLLSTVAN